MGLRGEVTPPGSPDERSVRTRWGKRGGGCSVAGRSAQPLLPGPLLPPSPRPGLSRLLPQLRLPPSPPPRRHNRTRPPPSLPQTPPTFPSPRFLSHLSGARRNCRPGGSSGRLPSSLLAFASLTGEGRPEEGEARSRGGRRSGRSARSCFPAFQREERKGGPSRLRARRRRRRRPLYRAAPPGARATPASASIPPPPPPAPRFPRAAPHSASSSHAAAQGYASHRHGSPPRSPCARASPPLPRCRLPGRLEKERKPCAQPRRGDPGRSAGPVEAGQRGQAAQWRIPKGFFPGPDPSALPAEGVKRRRRTLGAGVVGTTFCGSARQPPAPLFVRPPPTEPGEAPGPRRPPPGPGPRWAAGDGWLGLQSRRSTLGDSPRSRYEA